MSRRARIWLRIVLALAGLFLIVAITGVLILRSDWFRDSVRRRIITEIETATGASLAARTGSQCRPPFSDAGS